MTTATLTPPTNAPQLPARVGPLRSVQQTCSLAWRTLVQIKHNPFELVDFSVQPVMFLLLFVYVFGGALGGSPHAYLQYLLAGIMVQNSLFTTMNTATGLATDLDKGFFSRLRALPIARSAPLAGRIVADLAKQAWALALLYAVGTIMVNATFQVADAIALIVALSYLGLGIRPPQQDWGGMLSNGVQYVYDGYWWLIVPAGFLIVIVIAAAIFIGEGLRDAVEVRLQRR